MPSKTDTLLRDIRRVTKQQRKEAFEGSALLAERAAAGDQQALNGFEAAVGRVVELDQRLAALPDVRVTSERGPYYAGSDHSFMIDAAVARGHLVRGVSQPQAEERLAAHRQHANEERKARDAGARAAAAQHGVIVADNSAPLRSGVQNRAGLGAYAAAIGGTFSPPQHLLSSWVDIVRSAAPVTAQLARLDLPSDGMEIYVPQVTAQGGVVSPRQVDNASAADVSTAETTDDVVVPVVTFSGEAVLSQQLYDRGPNIDQVLNSQMAESFAEQLEADVIAGSGSDGHLSGLLALSTDAVAAGQPGATQLTWTEASPTPVGLIQQVASLAATVSNARKRPPSFAVMTPSRGFWVAGSGSDTDTTSQQRVGTGYMPGSLAATAPFTTIAGLPTYVSGEIPIDVGASGQDTVIVARGQDVLVLVSDPVFQAFPEGGDASSMTVRCVWHAYAALVVRVPSAVGSLQGTGMTIQEGF